MNEKVVLLCGGKGTRIREETEFKPKPLVEIGGLPVLWHIMKNYSVHGYDNFVLCLGYKGRMIKEFFMHYEWDVFDYTVKLKDNKHTYHREHELEDWTITFADTGLPTLTGGRVRKIEKYIPKEDEFFMLTYGDGLSNVDIAKLVAFHKQHGKMATITGVQPTGQFGSLEINDKNLITNFKEKPKSRSFINGGFMVLNREVFDHINTDGSFEIEVLPKLADMGELAVFTHEGFWRPMDTHKDYLDLNKMWDESAPWKTWEVHPRRHHS